MSKPRAAFRVGVEYYRAPAPTPAFWEEDFAAIARAGFHMIRTFSFWNWMEPEPGVYQLDDFDRFFDLAAQNGLEVVFDLTLATHGACPEWMLRKHPDIRLVASDGRVAERSASSGAPQGSMIHCYDHPKWKEYGARLIETLVTRYREAPALGVWSVWDGCGPVHCYCENTMAAYRTWLRGRFTLEELNERLYRRYRSWEDVQPPRSSQAIVEMLLFKHFQHENLVEKLRWQVELVNRLDGKHEVHAHGTHFPRPWEEACGREVDSWGFACRSNELLTGGDPYSLADQFFWARWSRSVGKGGRWWYDEIYSSMIPFERRTEPEELQALLWMTVAEGGAVAQFWQYRPEYMTFEAPGLNLVGLNGLPTPRLTAVSHTIREIESLGEHLPLKIPAAEVAIVYHNWSDEVMGFNQSPEIYLAGMTRLHRALWEHNIPVDVITAAVDWAPYRLICLPNATLLDGQLIQRISGLLKNGRDTCFLADGLLGLHAGDGRFSYDPPEGLSQLLGVRALDYARLTEREIQQGRATLSTHLGEFPITGPCSYATLQPFGGTSAFARLGEEVVGVRSEDHRFTWISLSLTTGLAGDALRDLLIPFVMSCGVSLPVQTRGDKVIVQCRQSALGGWLLFVFNVEARSATVEVVPAFEFSTVTELLSGRSAPVANSAFSLEVKPRSVSVAYCAPPL